MKKLNAFAVAAVTAVVALTGCQSISTSDAGGLTINPKTVCPVDAYRPTYKVDSAKTVTGNAQIHALFGIFTWGGAGTADYADFAGDSILAKILPSAKAKGAKAAVYDACVANNCDALVASRYTVKAKDYIVYAKYDITVEGYPVTQTGVETIKPVPYYIDAGGKVVILDKFVNMVNVAPATAKEEGWLF